MQNKISIITPSYNSSEFIKETIESVLNQTYTNWEWFIIDDCSKDNSNEVINSFKDERMEKIKALGMPKMIYGYLNF